jgi:limonene 1,2-monooxygenase
MLADRIVLLDHLTKGRVMFGVGPGALPSDAFMMGIPTDKQRERMEEALEVMLRLFNGERVTHESDWFTLRDAKLQLAPYSDFDIAVAAQVSPSGPRCAGRFGLGLLSIGATSAGGFDVLGSHWGVMEQRGEEFGQPVNRDKWRLVGPMHIAETEEQARKDVEFGLKDWIDYFQKVAALPLAPETEDPGALVEAMNASGLAVIGTPDQAAAQIQRLVDQSNGGFGAYLFMANEWANTEATKHSYELFARYVMPQFQGTMPAPQESRDWAASNRPQFIGAATEAVMKAIGDHGAEQAAKAEAASS